MNEWEILLNFCYRSNVGRFVFFGFVLYSIAKLIFYFSKESKNNKNKQSHADYVLVNTPISITISIIIIIMPAALFCADTGGSFVLDNKNLVMVYPQNWLALKPIKGEIVSYKKQNFVAYNGTYEIRASFGGDFLPVYQAVKECGCIEHFIRSRIKQNSQFLVMGNDTLFSDLLKEDGIIVLSIEKTDDVRIQKL